MVFSDGTMEIPQDYEEMRNLFDHTEKGAGKSWMIL
jgi:phytoene desaturase